MLGCILLSIFLSEICDCAKFFAVVAAQEPKHGAGGPRERDRGPERRHREEQQGDGDAHVDPREGEQRLPAGEGLHGDRALVAPRRD